MTVVAEGDRSAVRSADGTEIAFHRMGSGPPIVIVHAGLGSSRSWLPVAELLADRWECFLVDRRGHGASADAPGDHSFADEVDDVRAVLAVAGPDAALVGHCYGASLALEAVRTAPTAVGALVMYDPGGRELHAQFPPDGVERLRGLVEAGELEAALERGLELMVASAALGPHEAQAALAARPSAAWDALVAGARTLPRELTAVMAAGGWTEEQIADVSLPALLVIGASSPVPHQREVAALARALPDARVHRLEGQGHVAHVSAPEQLAAAIAAFLGGDR